ncbi:MAG: hypothetical protein OXT69_13325 [Candidatus Poribacteria bacterium]|nr:hypothetical protein [Candidatus Poribacteria bacterium]
MKRWIFAFAAALFFGAVHFASALPRFSLMEGEGCHDCHANPAGAGLRDAHGHHFGQTKLSAVETREIESWISEHIQLGGDIRTQGYAYFDAESDAHFDNNNDGNGHDHDHDHETPHAPSNGVPESDSDFQFGGFMMQTDLYAQFMLSENLRVYVEQDLLHNTRQAYGLYGDEEAETYVKMGVFEPNYGLRIDDHTAFIRGGNPRAQHNNPAPHHVDGLFWGPNRSFKGVEVGSEILETYVTLGVYNAGFSPILPDNNNAKAFLARGETYLELDAVNVMIGANMYINKNEELSGESYTELTALFGSFIGVGNDNWTLMAEIDLIDNYLESVDDQGYGAEGYAFWSEGMLRLRKGLYLVGRVESFDPDADADKDSFLRGSVDVEWFPIPYLEIKNSLRITDQPAGLDTLRELLVQTHLWF